MVKGTKQPVTKSDGDSSADATQADTTPGQSPASAPPVATPAEGTLVLAVDWDVLKPATNPVNAPVKPASRRGLSKLAFVAALFDWAWTDLDGEP